MGAEVQIGLSAEVLAHPAIEGGKRVGWRETLLEEQAHRVALVAERRLHADKDIAELCAQHKDRLAIGLLRAGAGPHTASSSFR